MSPKQFTIGAAVFAVLGIAGAIFIDPIWLVLCLPMLFLAGIAL